MDQGLELIRIAHEFDGRRVLDGVDLAVGPGEVVSLLGPSGSGKSTCLRIAAGLEAVQEGEVRIDGRLVANTATHTPPEARQAGLVLQDFALFPHLTVLDNVAFGLKGSKPERRARARDLLDRVGLAGFAETYPHTLSGGEQQRVALARALAPEPKVMLMDEPFSSLDVTLRAALREETAALLKKRGVPTLIVTHDPQEAMALSDRIAVMREGRILQTGAPHEIYKTPANPFVMGFFGETNRLAAQADGAKVETPFGPVSALELAEGAPVDICIRAEDIEIAPQGVPATVLAVTPKDGQDRVVLALRDGTKLVTTCPAFGMVQEGAELFVDVAPDKARIFAAEDEAGGPLNP